MAPPVPSRRWIFCFAMAVAILWSLSVMADYKAEVGYAALSQELGSALPTGSGITVAQIEAKESSGFYAPSLTISQFAGDTITIESGGTIGVSGHATSVGLNLYGSTSMTPGINTIDCFYSYDWRANSLHVSSTKEPEPQTWRVLNASFVSTSGLQAKDADALRRFDYTIHRDGYVAVVGTDNNPDGSVPTLMASSYNALVVGLTNGAHSHGLTSLDAPGRIKPDIVAPSSYTSFAAPIVSSAAAMLLETADKNQALADASHHSEVIRSLLMAGASKTDRFADWDRTTTRPLDDVYGAGELNIANSYNMLVAGKCPAATDKTVPTTGWDYATGTADGNKLYFLDVPDGARATLAASLNWDRIVTNGLTTAGQWGNPQAKVANMDLRLFQANGFELTDVVDQSLSVVDNVETIYQTTLTPGRYALEVRSDMTDVPYALSWQTTTSDLILGDANGDGAIDLLDFYALQSSFGKSGRWSDGDFNSDGRVEFDDYLILEAEYGTQENEFQGAAAVPEPATMTLLAAGAVLLIRRRRP